MITARLTLAALLALACSSDPCAYTARAYTPPPAPESGCLGMLAPRGGAITSTGADACTDDWGTCTVVWPSDPPPSYWVGSAEVGAPMFVPISCNVRDCDTIERAYQAQDQDQ